MTTRHVCKDLVRGETGHWKCPTCDRYIPLCEKEFVAFDYGRTAICWRPKTHLGKHHPVMLASDRGEKL